MKLLKENVLQRSADAEQITIAPASQVLVKSSTLSGKSNAIYNK